MSNLFNNDRGGNAGPYGNNNNNYPGNNNNNQYSNYPPTGYMGPQQQAGSGYYHTDLNGRVTFYPNGTGPNQYYNQSGPNTYNNNGGVPQYGPNSYSNNGGGAPYGTNAYGNQQYGGGGGGGGRQEFDGRNHYGNR